MVYYNALYNWVGFHPQQITQPTKVFVHCSVQDQEHTLKKLVEVLCSDPRIQNPEKTADWHFCTT